jgi:hypothetical protein
MAENGALRRYYEQLGFEPRGEVLVEDFVAALYERRCRASEAAAAGEAVTLSAPSGDRHARIGSVRSQRERGRTASPTPKGGGAVLG